MNLAISKYTSIPSTLDVLIQSALLAKSLYLCNRPPRPSVAAIGVDWTQKELYFSGASPKEGMEHETCIEHGCLMEDGHCVRNVHAEVAVLKQLKNRNISHNGILYTINKPCYNCAKFIVENGIHTVYYAFTVYDEQRTLALWKMHDISIIDVCTNSTRAYIQQLLNGNKMPVIATQPTFAEIIQKS